MCCRNKLKPTVYGSSDAAAEQTTLGVILGIREGETGLKAIDWLALDLRPRVGQDLVFASILVFVPVASLLSKRYLCSLSQRAANFEWTNNLAYTMQLCQATKLDWSTMLLQHRIGCSV